MSMRAGLGIGIAVVVTHSATSAEAITPQNNSPLEVTGLISALLLHADRIWVKVRSAISIEELADKLAQDETKLAKLNDVNEDHVFETGDWLVLPSSASNKIKQLAAINASDLRRTPPLTPPVEAQEPARILIGDSLAKIANRYKLSITQLLRLNPDLQAARLVAGTQIRINNSTPSTARTILGLQPRPSGGLSWPEQPNFSFDNNPGAELTDNDWIWPTDGIFTSGYGWRSGELHQGIDIANNVGTPIRAARSGQVVFAGRKPGADQPGCLNVSLVEIRHADGALSRYSGNGEIIARLGQYIDQGTVISYMGETNAVCGSHLHFEILPVGRGSVNPLQFLPARSERTASCTPSDSLRCRLERLEMEGLSDKPAVPMLPVPTPLTSAIARQKGTTAPPKRFDKSLDELVRLGVVHPSERTYIRSGAASGSQPMDAGAFQQACRGGALSPGECRHGLPPRWGPRAAWPTQPDFGPISKPLSTREQSLLNQIRNGPVISWRRYGQCQYDWGGWKLHANGTRTTTADCGGTAMRWQVAVSCERLLVATLSKDGKWSSWKRPAGPDSKFRQGEDEMVAALCANISD